MGLRIGFQELNVMDTIALGVAARDVEHGLRNVDRAHMTGRTDPPCNFEARGPTAATNVDHALAFARGERVERLQSDWPDLRVKALLHGRPCVARPRVPIGDLVGVRRCRR